MIISDLKLFSVFLQATGPHTEDNYNDIHPPPSHPYNSKNARLKCQNRLSHCKGVISAYRILNCSILSSICSIELYALHFGVTAEVSDVSFKKRGGHW